MGALGTPLLGGRDFARTDVEGRQRVAIVNSAFVQRALDGRDPIGRRVRFPNTGDSTWYEIVGVVGPLGVNVLNADRGEAARLITELAPGHLDMVFFTNGGAEATENAIRMARLHTGRHKVLTTYRSYHGATAGAITMTGDPRRWPSEPTAVGMVKFWGPYLYRSAFHATTEAEERDRALQHLADVIMVEGATTIHVTAGGGGPVHVALLSIDGRRVFAKLENAPEEGQAFEQMIAGQQVNLLVKDDGDQYFQIPRSSGFDVGRLVQAIRRRVGVS